MPMICWRAFRRPNPRWVGSLPWLPFQISTQIGRASCREIARCCVFIVVFMMMTAYDLATCLEFRRVLFRSCAVIITLLLWVNIMARIMLYTAAWIANPPLPNDADDLLARIPAP